MKKRVAVISWFIGMGTGLLYYSPISNGYPNRDVAQLLCPICPLCIFGIPPSQFASRFAVLNGLIFIPIGLIIFVVGRAISRTLRSSTSN